MRTELVRQLEEFFVHAGGIELAYLFGSRAAGEEGPMSDYDVAIVLSREPSDEARYDLAHRLAELVSDASVDLVVLNQAPVELQYAVVATGRRLYEKSVETRVEFEGRTLSKYFDYLPILRRQRSELLGENEHEAGVQRYRTALGKTEQLLAQIRTSQG